MCSKSQLHNKFAKNFIINDEYYDWITKSFEDRYTRNVMQKKENFHEVLIVFDILFINLEKRSHYLLQLTETTKERSSPESKI